MKLEAELKSSKPLPPRQRAVLNILFTASWLDCFLTRHLRPYGLTGPQYNILRILNGSLPKGLSVLDIKAGCSTAAAMSAAWWKNFASPGLSSVCRIPRIGVWLL
ncbi:MAG: hypothetical protein IPK76_07215 [Lewinellaceae bacterium]|nr:hypothetical protein [Lewinellaceae bacterium]